MSKHCVFRFFLRLYRFVCLSVARRETAERLDVSNEMNQLRARIEMLKRENDQLRSAAGASAPASAATGGSAMAPLPPPLSLPPLPVAAAENSSLLTLDGDDDTVMGGADLSIGECVHMLRSRVRGFLIEKLFSLVMQMQSVISFILFRLTLCT